MTVAALLALALGPLPQPGSAAPRVERAYAGASCRTAGGPACDRLGLAVTLRPRPRDAIALVDGRRVPLRPLGSGGMLAGHLRRAAPHRSLLVALIVTRNDDGHRSAVPVVTVIRPGWG